LQVQVRAQPKRRHRPYPVHFLAGQDLTGCGGGRWKLVILRQGAVRAVTGDGRRTYATFHVPFSQNNPLHSRKWHRIEKIDPKNMRFLVNKYPI
jgi:hypothetical protein